MQILYLLLRLIFCSLPLVGAGPSAGISNGRLLEGGGYRLLESGSYRLLE